MTDILALGIGLRRRRETTCLDVYYPIVVHQPSPTLINAIQSVLPKSALTTPNNTQVHTLSHNELERVAAMCHSNKSEFKADQLRLFSALFLGDESHPYAEHDCVLTLIPKTQDPITSTEDAYLRLHLLSHRCIKPHGISLQGLFSVLQTLAWSSVGPVLPQDVDLVRLSIKSKGQELTISHVDKFPYMVNYHIPSGVRIASGAQVRLGAYLGEGTTVMPSGFINFNAGTLSKAMVEGRISAGVVVGHNSDIGGGASIMGTLSGGNHHVISIGDQCLLGANSGVGISLGNGCTVEAGTYVTAGMKVSLLDAKNNPVDRNGNPVKDGQNNVKASELSGRDYLVFIRHSQTGQLQCKPNTAIIELNEQLHQN